MQYDDDQTHREGGVHDQVGDLGDVREPSSVQENVQHQEHCHHIDATRDADHNKVPRSQRLPITAWQGR